MFLRCLCVAFGLSIADSWLLLTVFFSAIFFLLAFFLFHFAIKICTWFLPCDCM